MEPNDSLFFGGLIDLCQTPQTLSLQLLYTVTGFLVEFCARLRSDSRQNEFIEYRVVLIDVPKSDLRERTGGPTHAVDLTVVDGRNL